MIELIANIVCLVAKGATVCILLWGFMKSLGEERWDRTIATLWLMFTITLPWPSWMR